MKRWRRAATAVAVAAAAMFVVVQSRNIADVVEDVAGTSTLLTLSIIAAAAFLETGFPVFSAFMPGEFTVILAGSLAATGVLDPITVFMVVWPCSFAGDLTSFAIGHRYGRPLLQRDRGRLTLSARQLDSADAAINRYGTASVLIGRFLPVARALVPFTAGAAAMRARTFVTVDIVATGAFSAAFVGAGYYGTDLYRAAPWALLVIGAGVAVQRQTRSTNSPPSHGQPAAHDLSWRRRPRLGRASRREATVPRHPPMTDRHAVPENS